MYRYSQLAAQHECVKFAHISFAAYAHYQETKNPLSKEICIRYTCDALRELQKEIESFSGENADAIVTASVALAGAADDWYVAHSHAPAYSSGKIINILVLRKQWLVFVDGYTRVI